ncbi:MAG: aquaporin, partial [Streptomyces sp.]|nr:aquaporin [Streptomyces sp.]
RKAAPGFAGIVIGLIVFAVIIPLAPATGAGINPARTTGPMLVQWLLGGAVHWEQWPVYIVAELIAGCAAAAVFAFISRTQADQPSVAAEARAEEESLA